MSKPQLKNIEEHLQFLVGQRNPFTKQDHLRKTSLPAVMRTALHFLRIYITINPPTPLKPWVQNTFRKMQRQQAKP
jgi:hypothetical protein